MTFKQQGDELDLAGRLPALPMLPALDERPGPARRLSSVRAAALVQAALSAEAASRVRTPRKWQRAVAAAAGVLLLAGVASASLYYRHWFGRGAGQTTEIHGGTAPEARVATPTTQPAGAAKAAGEVPAADGARSAPALGPAPVFAESEQVATPALGSAHHHETLRSTRAAEDLLRVANEHRRQKQWQEADATYQRVRRAHPGTAAAYVAGVASASLHLEKLGDARGALRLYRAALAAQPHGSLAEEARYGIAESYRALGDRRGEGQALSAFVAAHPTSPLRGRAEDRLHALAAP